jgi:hypothetical protein
VNAAQGDGATALVPAKKSVPVGALPDDIRALIRTMSKANPLWGAPRIHGELLKLGMDVCQATITKYMVRRCKPPSQPWRTFLTNHRQQIAAADFFVVPTATTSDAVNFPNSFSGDGQLLAYVAVTPETRSDIWVLRMSDRKTQPFLQSPYEETAPAFSHDGRWLAYSSDESGRREVDVQPYPGPGGKWHRLRSKTFPGLISRFDPTIVIAADGRSYAYSSRRVTSSDLHVAREQR